MAWSSARNSARWWSISASAEGVVRRDEMIPRESFRAGDRIRAYIYDVRRETRGPQIFLSRCHPQFMVRLFAQEVPEIYDGIIEIRAVARDPGSRAKIAVISKDSSHRSGRRLRRHARRARAGGGAGTAGRTHRHHSVVRRSRRPSSSMRWRRPKSPRWCWTKTPTASKWWCPTSSLSLAIGRRGQNVRLASQLTGWQIDILTEAEESERRQKEFADRTQLFMESLDVDETVAQLLASEGFATIEDVAYVRCWANWPRSKPSTRRPRRNCRAAPSNSSRPATRKWTTSARRWASRTRCWKSKASPPPWRWRWAKRGIKTLEDLAGCATDDLLGYYEVNKEKERVRVPGALEGFNLTSDDANAIIMKARVKIGWIEEEPEEAAEEEVAGRRRPRLMTAAAREWMTTSDAGKLDADDASLARTPLHRHGRSHAREPPDPLCRRARWRGRARCRGQTAGPGHVGGGDARRRRHGGGEESFRPRRQGAVSRPRPIWPTAPKRRWSTRMLGDLGLARRSGALVLGFDNVLRALEGAAPPALLIEASDGSADGKRKLYNAAHARGLKLAGDRMPYQRRIGLGLGRENVIHAAVQPGGLRNG